MSMLVSAAPVFMVGDVAAAARWYGDVLGFEAEVTPSVAILRRGRAEIILRREEGFVRRPGAAFQWDAYLRLSGDELKLLYHQLKDKVKIVRPLEKTSRGDTEFEIADGNGYVLCFSELIRRSEETTIVRRPMRFMGRR
jgi:catechol 2,3-dioxygenase-like lactoylglutathione lyase family enzyme